MILGTAGHIDHGKTTLVRALTGVDADRLPEEKRRGITIELGFAPLLLEGFGTIGIVDVPGHEGFVRTMVAGATGVDIAMLVVAADEGVMPQTREHTTILELLGVTSGVVALTKCDLAEPDWMDLVADDIARLLAGGPLAGAPVIRCSAVTGAGLVELRAAIAAAARRVPPRRPEDLLRMPVDRAFSVKGTGTVVTGTLWSGAVRTDDIVALAPGGPNGRVRSVESHGSRLAAAVCGERAAVALAGVDRASVAPRGTTLVRAGDPWRPSRVLRADVSLVDGVGPIGPRTTVRFHLATANVAARLVAVGGPVRAGARAPVRVALEEPVVARAGDRFVLRMASPARTIGGGVVTDPAPRHRRPKPWAATDADVRTRLAWLVAEASGTGLAVQDLAVSLGVVSGSEEEVLDGVQGIERIGDRLFLATLRADVATQASRLVDDYHRTHPLDPGMPAAAIRSALGVAEVLANDAIRQLVESGRYRMSASVVARADWQPGAGVQEAARVSAVLDALTTAGIQPPSVAELATQFGRDVHAMLKLLAADGRVVAVSEDRYYAKETVTALERQVRAALADGLQLTASQLRERTGLTRKYLIPFLEYCDRTGLTVRSGDARRLRR